MQKMITLLGPTATGKTKLAVGVAVKLNGEVISVDSRQVYREMDIGTGKDLEDFHVNGTNIQYHLIDIVEPGYEYNVYEFRKDFIDAIQQIISKRKLPVLCGGSGLYMDAVLRNYTLERVPVDHALRKSFEQFSDEELIAQLKKYGRLHNTTDTTDRQRTIRALEIAINDKNQEEQQIRLPAFQSVNFGVYFDRQKLRERITKRLMKRISSGMVEEVEGLLKKGLKPEQLTFYGLEYKFITLYLTGQLKYDEMIEKLNIAIHQFAKRQMTWFRRMEKNGVEIDWINGENSVDENTAYIISKFQDAD